MFKHAFPLLLALVCAAPLGAGPADGVVSLEVLPGWRTDQGTHMAGLQIRLAPGWKTYWRAPGDGGIPPRFGWQGSQNMEGVAFHWPVPEVFDQNGMRSYGYAESVVIPVEVSVPDAARRARMKGAVQLGVCEDICVPVLLEFDAVLPVPGARTPAIVSALVDQPTPGARAGVTGATCTLRPTDRGLEVTTRIEMPRHAPDEVVVIEAGDQQVWVSQPEIWRDGDLFARAEMIHVERGAFALNRSEMRITVLTGGQAVDIQGCTAG